MTFYSCSIPERGLDRFTGDRSRPLSGPAVGWSASPVSAARAWLVVRRPHIHQGRLHSVGAGGAASGAPPAPRRQEGPARGGTGGEGRGGSVARGAARAHLAPAGGGGALSPARQAREACPPPTARAAHQHAWRGAWRAARAAGGRSGSQMRQPCKWCADLRCRCRQQSSNCESQLPGSDRPPVLREHITTPRVIKRLWDCCSFCAGVCVR